MDDVFKMDSAALNRELYLISYAIFSTFAIICSLYYFLDLYDKYEDGRLTSAQCSAKLNFWFPIRVFLHMHCMIVLLVYRHPELFMLNLRMLIWHFKHIAVGYPQSEIEQRERLEEYRAQTWRHLYFFILALAVYAYCLSVPAKLKVAELEKENLKYYKYKAEIYMEGEGLLFGLQ